MKTRTVEIVASPKEPHFVGDGFRVHNFIPSRSKFDRQQMNPFIMLDYHATYQFPPTDKPKGVGVHPHQGFQTVTIAYKGSPSPNLLSNLYTYPSPEGLNQHL
ncbi:pirin family protein [Rhodocytophaga aerolata]|uniref:Pirin family protein n=1 Tax=Rhodocytophaga aerolata TaxID=455078 RepID=A0ABT8RIB1_9BACT|nr:pirin family protein [Rhodocytophaga aerolata]MDO1451846.1 pirin family protein [Rhodocytophaga aerolata]